MVTVFYLSFTFFFEHFLQGIMGLMCRMVCVFSILALPFFQTLSARN